jgi:hypothetical protein
VCLCVVVAEDEISLEVNGPGDEPGENRNRSQQPRQLRAPVGYNHANPTYIR